MFEKRALMEREQVFGHSFDLNGIKGVRRKSRVRCVGGLNSTHERRVEN